jgi:predicted solute-binding protein
MPEGESELAERGNEIFERVIRPQVNVEEEAHKYVAIDVETEDFEVDSDQRSASDRLLERHPEARGRIFFRRVGSRFAQRIGGRLQEGNAE